MIYRPIGTFEFAVVAAPRAEQLRRGCAPCGMDLPNQARLAQLDLSQVIVTTYHDEPIGFAAGKRVPAGMRVVHELWVDANAPGGLAPVVILFLGQLEKEVLKSGCSTLFIVVPQGTRLRRILCTYGYAITLEGADPFARGGVPDGT